LAGNLCRIGTKSDCQLAYLQAFRQSDLARKLGEAQEQRFASFENDPSEHRRRHTVSPVEERHAKYVLKMLETSCQGRLRAT
jgi:hypothetical protein